MNAIPMSLALLAALAGADPEGPEGEITAILKEQAGAWNRGDLNAFMEPYWKSGKLTFSSGGKVTRGWDDTLARYKERYPDRAAMGELSFSDLEVSPLGSEAALVLGRFRLKRESDEPSGNFTLVFRKIDGEWKIVHDHTSPDAD